MARNKTTAPNPSRHVGEKNIPLPAYYLDRILPAWRHPEWVDADRWRYAVRQQPVCVAYRDTMISNLVSLDWKIEPKESNKREEYKEEIDYYTDFFNDTGEYEYATILEWIFKDVQDIPFGGAAELGWENNKESDNSRLLWIKLLDGGTLFPTANYDWPVGQYVKESGLQTVYFPRYAINRVYTSPQTNITRYGWGCAPPESIYLGLEALNRGDMYYVNLLLDSPEVGILDLGDMSETSAQQWVKSWRELLIGIDPFKIPVLYGHEKPATFISFTRSPTELLFDRTILRYSALVGAGYGMSIGDIGLAGSSSSGETLAGTIRQERRTKRTGFGKMKKKMVSFFNRMLPPYLKYLVIDMDDELAVSLSRARLANATAFGQMVDKRYFTPKEARLQSIADGLITISIPEDIPEDELPEQPQFNQPFGNTNERTNMLGKPVNPSQGGHGEVIPKAELFDILMEEVPDFRDLVEDLEKDWNDLSPNQRDFVVEELQKCLQVENT